MAGQPTPYLGSKISLISKSEIRYEGILYTVDTKESTIALAKVKSFGTEDRPTEHPVAARDETYEYIIFKASDIKDLMVCETPKPVPQLCPGLPYDPAIVSVSQQPKPQAPPAAASLAPSAPATYSTMKPLVQSGSSSRSATPHQRSASPTVDIGVQATSQRAPGAGRLSVGQNTRGQNRRPPPQQQQQHQQQQIQHQTREMRGGFRQQQGRGGWYQQGQHGNLSYRNALTGGVEPRRDGNLGQNRGFRYQNTRGFQYQNTGRGSSGRGVGLSQRGRHQPSQQNQLKFDSDYDFEKANEQFQETLNNLKEEFVKAKISTEKETEEKKDDSGTETQVDVEETEEEKEHGFYDKSTSFFDRISCEALERQQNAERAKEGDGIPRANWRREREQNLETFGQAAVRNYQYRRAGMRGAMRGYGFRGAFRPRPGYGRGGAGYYYYNRY